MPSHIMDHSHLFSLFMRSASSSFFTEDICLPSEGQLGFWKAENLQDQFGLEGIPLMSGSKSVSSSPSEKLQPVGGNYINYLELPRTFISMEQKERISAENHLLGTESTLNLSMTSLEASNQDILPQTNLFQQPEANGLYYENSLFLGSFSEAFGKKDTEFKKDEPLESLKEVEAQTIGDLLPNDDDLLSGVIDNTELVVQANSGDEDDLFYSGGGMELESDESFNCKRTSGFVSAGASNSQIDDMNNKFPSELMYGKHPSRTLILRNIDSKVDEAELKILFEQFGEIRVLHMASKHQGFVLVSYYDIRASNNAMRSLQNKLLRQRKIDIHYYFSKDNAFDINVTRATLVVSNLDSSFTNDDVHQIFGSFGEIKEIFYNPHYQNQRAMEFYDVRAAEAALCALNMSDIAGKRIKVEPGCPGVGWSLGKLSPLELGKEGSIICRNGDSSNNPLLEIGASSGSMCVVNTSVGLDNRFIHSSPLQTHKPFMERKFTGISSNVPHSRSSPDWVAMLGNHCSQSSSDELSNSLGQMNFAFRSISTIHPHSLLEFHDGLISGIPFNSVSAIQPTGTHNNFRIADVMDNQLNRGGSGHINSQSFELKEDFGISGKESFPINEHQYILNNSNADFHQQPDSLMWQNSPSILNGIPAPPPRLRRLPRGPSHMLNTFVPLNHHHVGSSPALIPSIWERCSTYAGDCMEATSFYPASLGNMGFCGSPQMPPLGFASHSIHPHAGRNCMDPSISLTHTGSPSPQQRSHMFHGRNRMSSLPSSYDAPGERCRTRQIDAGANQTDNKRRFELDVDRIISGEDSRTTLMIKNIPNKYTSKMLLTTIDEHHKGTYDFIYLPIDFKNKCNVGYAFINLTEPKNIIPFHRAYNGKKWEKFNSEKVASLAYARIQGKAALIAHFQNSSLMNEDKRCRPILFHSDGPNAGDQEPFPLGTHIRSRPGRSRITNNEEHHQRSPSDSGNGDDSNSTDSSSSAIKDYEGSESSFIGTLTTKK